MTLILFIAALLSLQEPNDKVFDWLKTLRYHMNTANIGCLIPQSQDEKQDLMYALTPAQSKSKEFNFT